MTKVQGQFNGDRLLDTAKLLQHFGFASLPPPDTDLLVVCPSGEPTSALIIATNSQAHRPPAMEEGDASFYDVRGAHISLTKDGPVVDGGGGPLTIQNCSTITINGATTVTVNGAETLNVTASEAINFDTPVLKVTGDVIASDVA